MHKNFTKFEKILAAIFFALLLPCTVNAMTIEKTAVGPFPWHPGGTGSYQVVVTNTGSPIAPGTILTVHDDGNFPSPPLSLTGISAAPGWVCSSGQCTYTVGPTPVSVGTTWTFTINVSIDATYTGGVVQNCVELTKQHPGAVATKVGCACSSVSIQPVTTSFTLNKTVIGTPWQPGGTGAYQVVVTNTGGDINAGTLIVQDDGNFPSPPLSLINITAPPGWDCTTTPGQCSYNGSYPIPAGASWTFTVNVSIDSTYAGGTVQNCAQLMLQQAGPPVLLANGCVNTTIGVVQPTGPAITKTAIGPLPWQAGGTGTFEITETSPWTLSGLHMIVKDVLPPPFSLSTPQPSNAPWVCNDWSNPMFNYPPLYPPYPGSPPPPSNWLICMLDPSSSLYPIHAGDPLPPIHVKVDIDPAYAGGYAQNCAEIGHETPADPIWYNQPGCTKLPIKKNNQKVSLTLEKTAIGSQWQPGGTGAYQVVVTNNGGDINAGTLIVQDDGNFPSPPLSLINITAPPGWDCTTTPGQCSYNGSYPIPAGASWTFTVHVSVSNLYTGGAVQNCAQVTFEGAGPPQLMANGCATANVSSNSSGFCTTDADCVGPVLMSCISNMCVPLISASCANNQNGGSCNDGNACTVNDICSNQACIGTPLICDDGNVNTIDSCNPNVGCIFSPVAQNPSGNSSFSVQMKHSPRTFSTGSKGTLRLKAKNKGSTLEKGMLTVVEHLPVGLSVKSGDFRANSWRCKGGMISSSGQDVTCTYNRKLGKQKKGTLNLNVSVTHVGNHAVHVKEVEYCATVSVKGAANGAAIQQQSPVTVCDKIRIKHEKSNSIFNLPIGIGIGLGGIGAGGGKGVGRGAVP